MTTPPVHFVKLRCTCSRLHRDRASNKNMQMKQRKEAEKLQSAECTVYAYHTAMRCHIAISFSAAKIRSRF